jgi:hypothetical protein
MKFSSLIWYSLPFLALSCSSDDGPETGVAASGTGGSPTASAGTAGNGGGATAAAGASAGSGGSSAGTPGTSEGGSGTVPLATPEANPISGGARDAGQDPIADAGSGEEGDTLDDGTMTFFVTSTGMGDGGNLGGLAGADAFCEQLAVAQSADLARRTWHAYLSTSTVNARDRIGAGPWRNAAGVLVANSVAQLHDPANVAAGGPLDTTWAINDTSIPLDQTGAVVPTGGASGGNVHDILTGTLMDGTVAANETCVDWTSNADDPNISARIGHTNRTGIAGQRQLWNDVHSVGCSQSGTQNVTTGGGRGSVYCFAVITGE